MGIGLLAGSTVMLLTVIWGSCVIVGKCDLENNIARDLQDTKVFSLTGMSILLSSFNVLNLPLTVHATLMKGSFLLLKNSSKVNCTKPPTHNERT